MLRRRCGARRRVVSRTQAALVNATAAHSFEYDDIHMGGMVHPGALASARRCRSARGRRRRAASCSPRSSPGARSVRGWASSVGTAHFRAGYHPQGTVGVFVAARRLRARCCGSTPPHCATPSGSRDPGGGPDGGPGGRDGQAAPLRTCVPEWREKRPSWPRRASRASRTCSKPSSADSARRWAGGEVDLEALTSGLGSRWETDEIGFKPYASCAAAQSSIEVARRIREDLLASGAVARSVTDPLQHALEGPLRMGVPAEWRDRGPDEHPVRRGLHARSTVTCRRTGSPRRRSATRHRGAGAARGRRGRRDHRRARARAALRRARGGARRMTGGSRERDDRPGGPTQPMPRPASRTNSQGWRLRASARLAKAAPASSSASRTSTTSSS